MTDNTYNGWANYETWNVALWIMNQYSLYSLAYCWVQDRRDSGYDSLSYDVFRFTLASESGSNKTPDGVRWDDERIHIGELTAMLEELDEW